MRAREKKSAGRNFEQKPESRKRKKLRQKEKEQPGIAQNSYLCQIAREASPPNPGKPHKNTHKITKVCAILWVNSASC